jgi:hypothetical protein
MPGRRGCGLRAFFLEISLLTLAVQCSQMKSHHLGRLVFPLVRETGLRTLVLGLCTLFALTALAFDYPLQPEEIEQAYSLGRTTNHEDLTNFLNQYEHDFQYPSDHPLAYVTSVEFQTPYEQIVLKSMRAAQYSKFKAADDYQASGGAVFVRVIVALRIGFAGAPPPEGSFQVVVAQSKPIEPAVTANAVLCDPSEPLTYPVGSGACGTYTREILLRFDHKQFASGKATVKITLPESSSLETSFNLSKLK